MTSRLSDALSPGFAEPAAEAQRCFRAVLDAMARPGTIHAVTGLAPPPPLPAALAAALLTLADHETPLWLDPRAEAARSWIGFHCGTPFTEEPARAVFGVALTWTDLTLFNPGTHETPEASATILLAVRGLGAGRPYRLRGPGLRDAAVLEVDGLPADFAAQWQRNHARFPCGVDLLLCAGDRLTALPRSTSLEGG